MKVAAIIVAGGKGIRFGGSAPKQFLKLAGIDVFLHSVETFNALKFVKQVIVVVPEGYENYTEKLCLKYKNTVVVTGGAQRHNSVKNGLAALNKNIDIVAIHDGARPLTLPSDITSVCKAALKYSASLLATPAVDSIKFSESDGFVCRSIERSKIYMAQTPQVFKKEIILKAYASPLAAKAVITDDAQLVEKFSKVKIVVPVGENFKITSRADLEAAKLVLKKRAKEM
ncbi:MAG: 2-C-methyl-D-erythritol 4-phosphate cytidylyltransferase [Elusimicrobia bacterium]|nr:2-C-methyl-D-erythritol 4-phosphate cytidylyltransferase [Elusimicrobiota bacterium]